MAQGKFKKNAQLPSTIKQKSVHRGVAGAQSKATSSKVSKNKQKNNIQKTLQKNLENDTTASAIKWKNNNDFRQCFKLYAKEGYLSTVEKLGFIMRSLGMAPTSNELRAYFAKHRREQDGQVDFAEFLNILHEHLKNENSSTEMLNAFKAYDTKKTGFISSKELRAILTASGEKLSNKDVDMILREAGAQKDGRINYQNLVKVLSAPIPDY